MSKYLKIRILPFFTFFLTTFIVGISSCNNDKQSSPADINAESNLLPLLIKQSLIGKELFNWGKVEDKQIVNCRILNANSENNQVKCTAVLDLDNGAKNKPGYFFDCSFKDGQILSFIINKIEYNNPLAVGDFDAYSFRPLAGCKIYISTFGKKILVRTCSNCDFNAISTKEEEMNEIKVADIISIKATDKSTDRIRFTYIPITQQQIQLQ